MVHNLRRDMQHISTKLQRASYGTYRKVLLKLCQEHSDLDFTKALADFILADDIVGLVSLSDSLSSQKYEDARRHFLANQFAALILKYPHPGAENLFRPTDVAFKKFIHSEHYCKRVNQRLRARRRRVKDADKPFEFHMRKMRSFILHCVGNEAPLANIWSKCDFGPGASLGVHGNATNLSRKLLSSSWTVTPSAFHYAYAAFMSNSQTRELLAPGHGGFSSGGLDEEFNNFSKKVSFVKHNKIVFVPKTVKTLRSIAVEPLLNGFLQKGIDIYLRGCLRRVGIDLSDQEPNREMARQGSLPGLNQFSTIDLSSASDSISLELCRELLPPAWFDFLNSVRSKEFDSSLGRKTYEKFCSMGNGFCFPLETLLFTAACHAVGCRNPGREYRVYGDDIIVRGNFFEPLVKLLHYLGFKVNTKKTFHQGPFRESCGADWFGGEDVRPYILDHTLGSIPELFKFLNLTRRSQRTADFFVGVREDILSLIPDRYKFWRPYPGNPDTGIDSTGDEHLTSRFCTFSLRQRAWRWKEFKFTPVEDFFWREHGQDGNTVLLYGALRGSASTSPFTMRNITRTTTRFVTGSGATSKWLPHPPSNS